MKRLASTKLMKKLVVTVPKVVREMLDLKPGDYVDWSIEDSKIIVTKGGGKIEENG
ncbi:MAG: AbrB/MazE/SpoVT family DNA-binding domain-containing protein [archaeon YNP-LCB-003-016]|uniref:AbrB/MazE/SpoVT family DNA-binding domain-containing protein n=1 Tax=Candidatus Culexarchaeum yellowstonense TaxID=2928963 RepID=UPI0026EC209F|nr:AbrB/MazE/SpoVT family DNA-binding domain-containing protein [Candidatus Culexarchaeum yellowstonense]MCR6691416.1 AbrB/MazE/SpoVT family DNA-binding domain-containing protein [Candidatus Culexarchaeum yellowstonense]